MKALKVIVDELPGGCDQCDFAGDWHDMGDMDCFFEGEPVYGYEDSRPKWCPLMTEAEAINERLKTLQIGIDMGKTRGIYNYYDLEN